MEEELNSPEEQNKTSSSKVKAGLCRKGKNVKRKRKKCTKENEDESEEEEEF